MEPTMKWFFAHYCEHRGVPEAEKAFAEETFYGGAHTFMLIFDMVQDPTPLLSEIMAFNESKIAAEDKTTIH